MAHLMEARRRKKKIISMILIMHFEMLNFFTLMTIMLCCLVLSKRMKKRVRSQDSYERGELLPTRQPRQENESGLNETLIYNTTQAPSLANELQWDATTYRTGKHGGKRIKYNDNVFDSLLTSLNKFGEFYASSVESRQQLSSCFIHEKRAAERRNQVVSILKEMEGLSTYEAVRAGMLITEENNLCDFFFTLDTFELRKEFVKIILSNNGS